MATCSEERSGGTELYSPFVRRKLRALECPFRLDERAADWKSVRDIVVWLEEEKIRLYPRRRRIPLRTVDSWTEWWSLMKQYFQDLEAPLAHATSKDAATAKSQSLTALLDTVTSIAIGDVYQDALEANAVASGSAADVPETHNKKDCRLAYSGAAFTVTPEELQAALEPFLALLRLPPTCGSQTHDNEIISALRAVAARLQWSSPSSRAETEPLAPSPDEELSRIAARALVVLPVVGQSNEYFLTRFVSGLRAIHICTMRDTHERLDLVVEALQTLIGNPVTDSKLGKEPRHRPAWPTEDSGCDVEALLRLVYGILRQDQSRATFP